MPLTLVWREHGIYEDYDDILIGVFSSDDKARESLSMLPWDGGTEVWLKEHWGDWDGDYCVKYEAMPLCLDHKDSDLHVCRYTHDLSNEHHLYMSHTEVDVMNTDDLYPLTSKEEEGVIQWA